MDTPPNESEKQSLDVSNPIDPVPPADNTRPDVLITNIETVEKKDTRKYLILVASFCVLGVLSLIVWQKFKVQSVLEDRKIVTENQTLPPDNPSSVLFPSNFPETVTKIEVTPKAEDQPLEYPVYTDNEYGTFAFYGQGYTIDYPLKTQSDTVKNKVQVIPENVESRGAFSQTLGINLEGQGNPYLYISPSAIVKEQLAAISLSTIDTLERYSEAGTNQRIFPYVEGAKIISKETVKVGNIISYKVVETSPNSDTPNATKTTIIVPFKGNALDFSINNDSSQLNTILQSFKEIPDVPQSWIRHKSDKFRQFTFKYPHDAIISEKNLADKSINEITVASSQGDIKLFLHDTQSDCFKNIEQDNAGNIQFVTLSMERCLNEDIKNKKISQNFFTSTYSGYTSNAIRVYHPTKNTLSVYFLLINRGLIQVTFPKTAETTANQILMSMDQMIASGEYQ